MVYAIIPCRSYTIPKLNPYPTTSEAATKQSYTPLYQNITYSENQKVNIKHAKVVSYESSNRSNRRYVLRSGELHRYKAFCLSQYTHHTYRTEGQNSHVIRWPRACNSLNDRKAVSIPGEKQTVRLTNLHLQLTIRSNWISQPSDNLTAALLQYTEWTSERWVNLSNQRIAKCKNYHSLLPGYFFWPNCSDGFWTERQDRQLFEPLHTVGKNAELLRKKEHEFHISTLLKFERI